MLFRPIFFQVALEFEATTPQAWPRISQLFHFTIILIIIIHRLLITRIVIEEWWIEVLITQIGGEGVLEVAVVGVG